MAAGSCIQPEKSRENEGRLDRNTSSVSMEGSSARQAWRAWLQFAFSPGAGFARGSKEGHKLATPERLRLSIKNVRSQRMDQRAAALQQRERALLDLEQSLRVRERALIALEGVQQPTSFANEGAYSLGPASYAIRGLFISLARVHLVLSRV